MRIERILGSCATETTWPYGNLSNALPIVQDVRLQPPLNFSHHEKQTTLSNDELTFCFRLRSEAQETRSAILLSPSLRNPYITIGHHFSACDSGGRLRQRQKHRGLDRPTNQATDRRQGDDDEKVRDCKTEHFEHPNNRKHTDGRVESKNGGERELK